MIYYQNFPETSGSLSSLPIRDNFSFLNNTLKTHASSSANPHQVSLDQVCDQNATTDQAITVTSSGSVLKSLRVQNNEQIGGNLEANEIRSNGNIYLNYKGPDGDCYIYFYDGGSPTGKYLGWGDEFYELVTNIYNFSFLSAGNTIFKAPTGDMQFICDIGGINFIAGAFDKTLRFDSNNLFEWVKFDEDITRMTLDSATGNLEVMGNILVDSSGSVVKSLNVVNNLQVGGDIIGNIVTIDTLDDVCERGAETDQPITITSSGSVLKSLRVQNNEQVGGSLEVEGNILVDSSGSVLKSLRIQNNEQIGGSLEVEGNIKCEDLTLNQDFSNNDAIIYFNKPTTGVEAFYWDKDDNTFDLTDKLYIEGNLTVDGLDLRIDATGAGTSRLLFGPGTYGLTFDPGTSKFDLSNALTVESDLEVVGKINVTSSGSVLKSLRVQNNEQVGGSLEVEGNAKTDGYIQALTSGSVLKSLRVQNNLQVGGNLDVDGGSLRINANGGSDETCEIFFGNGPEGLRWDSVNQRFAFADNLAIDDSLLVNGATPGIHVNSIQATTLQMRNTGIGGFTLQVSGNLYVTGNDTIDGTIQALTSGSVLKSLRVQNNLQVGGNIIGSKKTIILPIDGATLPDGTTGNMAATIERIKSSAGAPSPHFMQAWFNSTTDSFLYWDFRMPNDYGSGLTAKVQYKMQTATSGSIVLGVAIMAVTPGDAQSVNADSMGTVNSATDTVPGTVNYLDEVSISLTNTDSLVAGDLAVIYLMRDADNVSDNAKGDVDVVAFSLEYNT